MVKVVSSEAADWRRWPSELCGLREKNLFHDGGETERDDDDDGRVTGAD
jgi:hypothetical protein